ncbi:MAG: hypothetical protein ACEQSF_04460 [Solirubrobacteraceae bacterium]
MLQFLGFLYWFVTLISGFWGIIFLSHVAIAWIVSGPLETFGIIAKNADDYKPRPTFKDQKDVEILYSK